MTIILYTLSKKPNSTFRPTEGREISGVLRQGSDVLNPTIGFTTISRPARYNYAYIPEFGRYYYAKWAWEAGEWTAYLSVDVLATWRDAIGQSVQYIARAAADYDGTIKDDFYPFKPQPLTRTITADRWPWEGGRAQSYVIGVVGAAESSGVTYYNLSAAAFGRLSAALMGDSSYLGTDFGALSAEVVKAMFNPFQYLTSVFAYPWPAGIATSSNIPLGWWNVSTPCTPNPGDRTYTTSFSIPAHPDAARGSFLNSYPYTDVQLVFPCFGTMPIDASKAAGSIFCEVAVDPKTGNATLTVTGAGGALLHHVTGQVGVPAMITQSSVNYIGAAISGMGAALSAAVPGVGLLGAAAGVGNAIGDLLPSVSRGGSNGSFVEFYQKPTITVTYRRPVSDNLALHGRPLCQTRKISELPGFVQVDHAELDIPATDAELDTITTFLEGGFFYE